MKPILAFIRGPRQILGTPQGVKTLYRNAALLDPRQSQFDAIWGSNIIAKVQKSP